jgi:HK97 family phage major capsid protein
MATIVRDLKLERAKLLKEARELNEKAEKEKRDFTQEEQNQYDALMNNVSSLGTRIQRAETLGVLEAELEEPENRGHRPEPEEQDGEEQPEPAPIRGNSGSASRYDDVLARMRALKDVRMTPGYAAAFRSFLQGEQVRGIEKRDLQADSDPMGGFLKSPPQFVAGLLKNVDNILFFRQPGWATVIPLPNSDELVGVSLDADPDDGEWTTEIGDITYDTSMAFGKRSLKPATLAKGIKISRKLLRVAPNSEELVTSRLAYKLAVPMEKKYLVGNGAGQPLGVFTASSDGISTNRDEATDNTSSAPTFDGLTNAKYKLKQQYWKAAKWLFHQDVMKVIAKIKDTTNQYIWRESVRVGEPDTVLGLPNFMSQYAPNTLTTGQYVGILGDFSFYWIADALSMEMQRLVELYSKTRQIGLHAWLETDGMPVLEEAFVRVKLG